MSGLNWRWSRTFVAAVVIIASSCTSGDAQPKPPRQLVNPAPPTTVSASRCAVELDIVRSEIEDLRSNLETRRNRVTIPIDEDIAYIGVDSSSAAEASERFVKLAGRLADLRDAFDALNGLEVDLPAECDTAELDGEVAATRSEIPEVPDLDGLIDRVNHLALVFRTAAEQDRVDPAKVALTIDGEEYPVLGACEALFREMTRRWTLVLELYEQDLQFGEDLDIAGQTEVERLADRARVDRVTQVLRPIPGLCLYGAEPNPFSSRLVDGTRIEIVSQPGLGVGR